MTEVPVHDSLGSSDAAIRLLYINPNSSKHFTQETCEYLKSRIPAEVAIDFYTAPSSAPASIDGVHDGITSSAVVLQELGLAQKDPASRSSYISKTYSGIVVACFSAHPLLSALKECLPKINGSSPPVVGIFESAVYLALQLGSKFGIATTGRRESRHLFSCDRSSFVEWEPLFADHLRTMGVSSGRIAAIRVSISHLCCITLRYQQGSGLGVLGLHGGSAEDALLSAALVLVEQGADMIVLGCAVRLYTAFVSLSDLKAREWLLLLKQWNRRSAIRPIGIYRSLMESKLL